MSEKARERLLYLISPIALLAIWQILLMLGFGDRRFIPAPSDIAVRFWELAANGELWVHTGVTLYRVFAGYLIGAIPAIAIGLVMAMFKPVRIFFDPLIAALFPIPKVALMPLLLLAFGFGDASRSRWSRPRCSFRSSSTPTRALPISTGSTGTSPELLGPAPTSCSPAWCFSARCQ
jgi:NitT/TauT family transport system permease protein